MAYYLIEDFRSGLDVRRSPWSSPAGTLQILLDGHITRGGEIEKRKTFADKSALSALTFGLAADQGGLVTFGSVSTPDDLPAGVRYQRLVAPDGAAMTGISSTTSFNGMLYVVADFSNGMQWHFYDGNLVTDWGGGIVLPYMVDNNGIAEHLTDIINASSTFTAVRTGTQIVISGSVGVNYDAAVSTANMTGGSDDQNLLLTTLQDSGAGQQAAQASGYFSIIGGVTGTGNGISYVRVMEGSTPVNLISSAVPFNVTPQKTAIDVANAVNTGFATHGYQAISKVSRVYIYAPDADGASANGRVVLVGSTGLVVLYDGSFKITGGTTAGGISNVTADGKEILGAAVTWGASNSATAAAVAAQINTYASSPKYNAWADGETVRVSPAAISSADSSQITIGVTTTGDLTLNGGAPADVTTDPGWNEPPTGCVVTYAVLPGNKVAGDVIPGDMLTVIDPVTFEIRQGRVSFSRRTFAQCYDVRCANGAWLPCSDTAPLPVRSGGNMTPPNIYGHETVTFIDGKPEWSCVTEVVPLGLQPVQHITCENTYFLAGGEDGKYIAHHNLKQVESP